MPVFTDLYDGEYGPYRIEIQTGGKITGPPISVFSPETCPVLIDTNLICQFRVILVKRLGMSAGAALLNIHNGDSLGTAVDSFSPYGDGMS